MNKHNFKALQTFRGWNEDKGEWVYGQYASCNLTHVSYIINDTCLSAGGLVSKQWVRVPKKSIGIYTGKDDKNGTPIFAGLPEDGNIGGDKLKDIYGEGIIAYCHYCDSRFEINDEMLTSFSNWIVIGTQYEQQLKETK